MRLEGYSLVCHNHNIGNRVDTAIPTGPSARTKDLASLEPMGETSLGASPGELSTDHAFCSTSAGDFTGPGSSSTVVDRLSWVLKSHATLRPKDPSVGVGTGTRGASAGQGTMLVLGCSVLTKIHS